MRAPLATAGALALLSCCALALPGPAQATGASCSDGSGGWDIYKVNDPTGQFSDSSCPGYIAVRQNADGSYEVGACNNGGGADAYYRVTAPDPTKSGTSSTGCPDVTPPAGAGWVGGSAPAESSVPGLPSGVPPAALRQEPTLPKPAGWPFPDAFPRTSGTGRLAGGAAFWTSYLYDDHGPFTGGYQNVYLGNADGGYTYPQGPAANNGADVFRNAVGLDGSASYWRVDWTTLESKAVPIAEWAIDSDASPATGTAAWTAGAGLSSPGIDHTLVVSGTHAILTDTLTGKRIDVSSGLSVDLASRSFIVRIPLSVLPLPLGGRSVVRLAAGLANAAGDGFASVASAQGGSSSLPPVYDVSYRSIEQEPPSYSGTPNPWNDDDQATTLAAAGADVSKFSYTIDWSKLRARVTTPEPQPRGISDRWYVSPLVPGQGVRSNVGYGDIRPVYMARVQPYAVYVPESWDGHSRLPVTWLLHSSTQTHNQYAADSSILQNLCEARHSLCVTTEGFGPISWYFDESDAEVFEVWRQLALAYPLDTEHTTIGGYSMGGYAAYKLGLEYPDLFAAAFSMEGPVNCSGGTNGPINSYGQQGRCASDGDGDTQPVLVNARWLPFFISQSLLDEFVPYETVARQVLSLDQLGYRYYFETVLGGEHLTEGSLDTYKTLAAALGTDRVRTTAPGQFTYSWYSDEPSPQLGTGASTVYWLDGIKARVKQPGRIATINARDAALPDATETAHRTATTSTDSGVPAVIVENTWQAGAAPAAVRELTLKLTDVAAVSVDTHEAQLPSGHATVTSDGEVVLRLEGLPASAKVTAAGKTYGAKQATTSGIQLSAGTTELSWS